MKPLTPKEQARLRKLHKKVANGKATRKEILEAIDLRNRDNATA